MAVNSAMFFIFLSLTVIPANTYLQQNQRGFISIDIFDKGLDYVKDSLIEKAISSIVPLELPEIEKTKKIPIIGTVHMVLSNITIYEVAISSSEIRTGEKGIRLVASGATANLSMAWRYSYRKWLIKISDSGNASVRVNGMEVGLAVELKNQNGTLELDLLDCSCHVNNVYIEMSGGASWLYQAIVNAFEPKIASVVEDAVSDKLKEGMSKIDYLLQSVPKEIPVKGIGLLNVSVVDTSVVSGSSIELEINGLFSGINNGLDSRQNYRGSELSGSCSHLSKMIKISINENVFNSALSVFFNAGYMQWTIDHLPNYQALLDTASWKYVLPQLYSQYPNDTMRLNITVSSPPVIQVVWGDIIANIDIDMTVHVVDGDEVIPIACLSSEISGSWLADISSDRISGAVTLEVFTTTLKWSGIGNLQMNLVQSAIRGIIKTVALPYINWRLWGGLPLPHFQGLKLYNTDVLINDSWLSVCSDVSYAQQYYLIHSIQ